MELKIMIIRDAFCLAEELVLQEYKTTSKIGPTILDSAAPPLLSTDSPF
jgi:hypothetical protein